jgi:uncharacterized protein
LCSLARSEYSPAVIARTLAASLPIDALLPVVGLLAGVLGGMLGIGGGLIIIPALIFLLGAEHYGPGSLHLYKLAALATAVVLSLPAARQHLRTGTLVRRMLPSMELFGIGGVIVGVWAASQLAGENTRLLQRIFGAFLIAFVAAQLWLASRSNAAAHGPQVCPTPARWGRIGLIAGLPAGVVSGLLGIGGGVWAVPAQTHVLGVRLTSAIANSTCMIVGIALTAAIAQGLAVHGMADTRLDWLEGLRLALFLAPGAIVGGLIGGKLLHVLPVARLRAVFYVVLVLTGARLLA